MESPAERIPWQETPLGQALLFLPTLFSLIWQSITYTTQTLIWILQTTTYPFLALSPHPILLYILAPFTVFFAIVLDLAVIGPYRVLLWFSDAFYPIYVFCGAACITGGIVGALGRMLTLRVINMVTVKEKQEEEEESQQQEVIQIRREEVKYELEDDPRW
ncbi:hypothetical protein Moror_7204 [Moniliophthora roreri MCA 2997]|uniref:Uncharacterized protein n=2 Tax=Moniliophthora roreri TaxID=221103 RepID=V2YWZ8_MONRO|nr:hypothetical protein Moror_7204 [Moniliophthora roreri MCA 2997]